MVSPVTAILDFVIPGAIKVTVSVRVRRRSFTIRDVVKMVVVPSCEVSEDPCQPAVERGFPGFEDPLFLTRKGVEQDFIISSLGIRSKISL